MVPLIFREWCALKTLVPLGVREACPLKNGSPGCPRRTRFKIMVPLDVRIGCPLKHGSPGCQIRTRFKNMLLWTWRRTQIRNILAFLLEHRYAYRYKQGMKKIISCSSVTFLAFLYVSTAYELQKIRKKSCTRWKWSDFTSERSYVTAEAGRRGSWGHILQGDAS